MVRTQVQFPPEQHQRLKRWAQQRGISLAEAVRRCVAEHLAADAAAPTRAALVREALTAAGTYRDPDNKDHIARNHDEHLARAYRK